MVNHFIIKKEPLSRGIILGSFCLKEKNMRYYLLKIAYNKVAMAEDRPQPSAYNSFDEAKKAFYSFFSQNILAPTIGWCMASVTTEQGVMAINPEVWEDPNIGEYYGTFIRDGVVNEKTNQPWVIDDVPERFKSQVEAWLAVNPPVNGEE